MTSPAWRGLAVMSTAQPYGGERAAAVLDQSAVAATPGAMPSHSPLVPNPRVKLEDQSRLLGKGEGDGKGDGDGHGEGDGDGKGEGEGNGDGDGKGDGEGDGHGEGDGEGEGRLVQGSSQSRVGSSNM